MTAAPWGARPPSAPTDPAPFRFGRDVPYRLYRLRRLWLAAMALPLLALLAAHGLGPWPVLPVALTLVWGLAAAALMVAFPARSHFEVLGGAVATAACLLVAGFGREVSVGTYALLAVVWLVVAVAVAVALEWAEPRTPRIRSAAGAFRRIRAAPEAAFDALATRPGRSWPGGETGAADAEGWFDLRLSRPYFDLDTRAIKLALVAFRARVVAQEGLGQAMELGAEGGARAMVTLAVAPAPGGCTARILWENAASPLLTVVLNALTDVRGDALQAEADVLEGLPAKAIWWQPAVSPFVRLAALLPAPEPDDGRPRL